MCAHLWRAGRDVTSRFPKDTNGALSMDTNGGGDEVDSLTILGCRRWVDGGWRGGARGRGRERRAGGRENTAAKTYVVVVVVWVGVWVAGSMILGVVVRLFSVTDFG